MDNYLIVPEDLFNRLVTTAAAFVETFPLTGQTPDDMDSLLKRIEDSEMAELMRDRLIEDCAGRITAEEIEEAIASV